MKTIVRILMTAAAVMMLANFANAQENRCIGAADRNYLADTDNVGSSFAWSLELPGGGDGAAYLSNANTDLCTIDWDNVALTDGTYTLSVVETYLGCTSDPITYSIIVHPKPTAIFDDLDGSVACEGDASDVIVNITSTSHWYLTYNNSLSGDVSVEGDAATQTISIGAVVETVTYSLVEIYNDVCTAPVDLSAATTHTVTVPVFGTTEIVPQ